MANKIIKFGTYPQNNGNTKEPIEWQVLQVNGNEVLLVSRYALDCKQYHHEEASITWENCDLRKWLNGEFLKAAFSDEEQERIMLSEVENAAGWYGTPGGNNTQDRVFCLSFREAVLYFQDNAERRCLPTALAKVHGADVTDNCCYWWLRTPGDGQKNAAEVYADGWIDPIGFRAYGDTFAVRPALWVNL